MYRCAVQQLQLANCIKSKRTIYVGAIVDSPWREARIDEGARKLTIAENRAHPHVPDGHILVHVKAAGLNRPDLMQRDGFYPAPPGSSPVPGLEVAGTVVGHSCNDTTSSFQPGDDVMALTNGGGFADYCVVPAGHLLALPKSMDFTAAAALPEGLFTVFHNVLQRGALKSGESFLVHGGASGIGTLAIQMAKAVGADVYTTAGTDAKVEMCERLLGATKAVNYKTQDFEAELKKPGMDVILDMVGGDYINKNLRILRSEGRLVSIAFQHGSRPKDVDFMRVMLKRLHITGSTLRSRSDADKRLIRDAMLEMLGTQISDGTFRPYIHNTYTFEHINDALHELETSPGRFGKLVVTMNK